MAFDQTTRNRLQRFVSDAKTLLIQEFTRQLQNEFGLNPETGEVSALSKLVFLDDTRRETAGILRETMAHYGATTPGADNRAVLSRIVREQAFTILNRMAALRMAEARGILMESIGNGYQSKGFQLYSYMAGSALGESGDAYQHYIFSIFDEFSLDLKVLFDRFSSQGRLFPKPSTLLELLDLINHPDIEALWVEDETIGWIYQYFNSKEERKKMRDASQAPRNSRELAVRNQFFTPRYVVEFLTDNTLGRIWYEMTQGKTGLVESCSYLVRRPNEIFLQKGENPPETEEEKEDLSQEEMLKQTLYVPFRQLKDPRELKMLDPACGSMHFGLYAFDLFEKIYDEAWELEATRVPENFERSKTFRPLHESYEDKSHFLQEVPRLIIENNIHGVDIDPRAVQIAGLSLWLRAQKAWHGMGISASHRPQVQKSNIVCAEPMPGEDYLLKEFTANIQPRVIGQLVEIIFEKMKLAGEAGSLLKIEEEIQDAIKDAREEYNQEVLQKKGEKGFLPGMAPIRQPTLFDFIDLPDDEEFWDQAEHKILDGLRDYAEHAEGEDSSQKRLFAQDAAKGFAFIDLCRKRFDVVLMNPPFGEPCKTMGKIFTILYPNGKTNIYACFVEKAVDICLDNGMIGAITSRSGFFQTTLSKWRKELIQGKKTVSLFADLGPNVLDAAMVETAVYCISKKTDNSIFFNLLNEENKELILSKATKWETNRNYFITQLESFLYIPGAPFAYSVSSKIFTSFRDLNQLDNDNRHVRMGLSTKFDQRFLRTFWEVPPNKIGRENVWARYANGGEAIPFFYNYSLVVLSLNNFKEMRSYLDSKYPYLNGNLGFILHDENDYNCPVIGWPLRAKRFCPQLLPKDFIFSARTYALLLSEENIYSYLSLLSSKVVHNLLRIQLGETGRPEYVTSAVRSLPIPILKEEFAKELERLGRLAVRLYNQIAASDETSPVFYPYPIISMNSLKEIHHKIEKVCLSVYDICTSDLLSCGQDIMNFPSDKIEENLTQLSDPSIILGIIMGRWNVKILNNVNDCTIDDYFQAWPNCPLAMLVNSEGLPASADDVSINYPIKISWTGLTVDDKGHTEDIVTRTREVIAEGWKDNPETIEHSICQRFKVSSLRDYFKKPTKFFADHLKRYTKSRRHAPIYWPFSTPSCSYTLWLYYYRVDDQILYTCVNDFVDPKLKQVTDDVGELQKNTTRSTQEEKDLEKLINLELELTDFRDELLRIAKFWKPNLNDGVQITAAPLWKLFQYKPWQKKLKATWEKLEKGDYDWAHLAYSIWPERVKEKCKSDKSLAIAHDLEDLYEEPPEKPKKKRRKKAK